MLFPVLNLHIMKKLAFVGALMLALSNQISAQCAMCSATAESSLESGSTAATGLNMGVLYLLVMPIIFASVFVVLYLIRQKQLKKEQESSHNETYN